MLIKFISRFILLNIITQLLFSQTAQDYREWSYFKQVQAQTQTQNQTQTKNQTGQKSATGNSTSAPSTTNKTSNVKMDPETEKEMGRLKEITGDPDEIKLDDKKMSQEEVDNVVNSDSQMKKLLGDVDVEGPLEEKQVSNTHIAQGTNNKEEKVEQPKHEFCAATGSQKCSQCDSLSGKNKSLCIAALEDGFFNLDQYVSLTGLNIEGLVYLLFAGMSMMECKMKMNCPLASSAPTSQILVLLGKTWIGKEVALNKQYEDEIENIKKYILMINDDKFASETIEKEKKSAEEVETDKELNDIINKNSEVKKVEKPKEETKKEEHQRPKISDIKKFYALMIIAYKKIYDVYTKKQNLLRMTYAMLYATFALGILEFVVEILLIILVIVVAAVLDLLIVVVYLVILVILIIVMAILFALGVVGGVATAAVLIVYFIVGLIVAVVLIAVVSVVAVVVILILYLYFSPIIPGCLFGGPDSIVAFTTLGITACAGVDDKMMSTLQPVEEIYNQVMDTLKSFDVILGLLDSFIPTFTLPFTDIPRQLKTYNDLEKSLGIKGKPKCAFNFIMGWVVFPIGALLLFTHPVGRGLFAFIHGVLGMFISEIFIENIKKKIEFRIDYLKRILKYLSKLNDGEERTGSEAGSGSESYEFDKEKDDEAKLNAFLKKMEVENNKSASGGASSNVCFCNDELDHGCKKSKSSCSENKPTVDFPRQQEATSKIPPGYASHMEKHLSEIQRDFNDITRGTVSDDELLRRAGHRLAAAKDMKNKADQKYAEIMNLAFIKNNPRVQKALAYKDEKDKVIKENLIPALTKRIKDNPLLMNLPVFGFNDSTQKVPEIKKEFIQEVKEIIKEEAKKELSPEEMDKLFNEADIDLDVAMPNMDLKSDLLSNDTGIVKNADFSKLNSMKSLDITDNKEITLFQIISRKHQEKYRQELLNVP